VKTKAAFSARHKPTAVGCGGAQSSEHLHPTGVAIYEVDEVDSQMFIAMEFIEGQSLREKIEDGPSKIEDAIKFAVPREIKVQDFIS